MPITLETPITGPVITRKEVTSFAVDLAGGTVTLGLAGLDDSGNVIDTASAVASLYRPDGAPRFTPELYGQIKAALYAIALEDGIVAGTVA